MKDVWLYSESEDLYWELSEEFDSKEDAIYAAKHDDELEHNNSIFVGKKTQPIVCGIDVDYLLENVSINTTIGLDGFGDDFLMNVKKEHFEELENKFNEIFFEWIKKYNYEPDWFEVEDVELIELNKIQ